MLTLPLQMKSFSRPDHVIHPQKMLTTKQELDPDVRQVLNQTCEFLTGIKQNKISKANQSMADELKSIIGQVLNKFEPDAQGDQQAPPSASDLVDNSSQKDVT
jgi:hypothetical protein